MAKLNFCSRPTLPTLLAFAMLCAVGGLPLQGQTHENWSGWSPLGQNLASAPAAARNNDGKLEVFFRGSDNQMYHSKQVFPGNEAWDPLTNLEWGHVGNPVSIADSQNKLWLFVRGTNGVLFYKYQQGAPGGEWSRWFSFVGAIQGDPAVVLFDNRLHVFVRGTSPGNALYYKAQMSEGSDSWSGWVALGGVLAANPAAVSFGPEGRLEVFVRGSDGGIHYRSWSGAWSGWGRLGTLVGSSDPAVASNGSVIEVVARGSDERLWRITRSFGQGWTGLSWINLGGPANASAPTLAANHDGRMEIFLLGTDGNVYHNYQDFAGGSFTGWNSLGGMPAAGFDIAVAKNDNGRLQIFVRTGGGALEYKSQVVPGG